jgi:hypothetical protein
MRTPPGGPCVPQLHRRCGWRRGPRRHSHGDRRNEGVAVDLNCLLTVASGLPSLPCVARVRDRFCAAGSNVVSGSPPLTLVDSLALFRFREFFDCDGHRRHHWSHLFSTCVLVISAVSPGETVVSHVIVRHARQDGLRLGKAAEEQDQPGPRHEVGVIPVPLTERPLCVIQATYSTAPPNVVHENSLLLLSVQCAYEAALAPSDN